MPVGFQTFDAAGNLKLSLGDRVARFTGSVVTNGQDGAITVAGVDTGEPFFQLTALENPAGLFRPPLVRINGNVISWTYVETPTSPYKVNCLLRFGVR